MSFEVVAPEFLISRLLIARAHRKRTDNPIVTFGDLEKFGKLLQRGAIHAGLKVSFSFSPKSRDYALKLYPQFQVQGRTIRIAKGYYIDDLNHLFHGGLSNKLENVIQIAAEKFYSKTWLKITHTFKEMLKAPS